jgi:NitT/TauT family transport system substrate-binding protein
MTLDVVLAVPDLVSPSYFPAIAAVDLGFVRDEGLEARLELRFPVTEAARALREGRIDLLACAAHDPLHAFPEWRGAKLVTALSRYSYWFLVMRADLGIAPGELTALRDVRIAAAPGPELALRVMLAEAGIDIEALGISMTPVPPSQEAGTSFGLAAAAALAGGAVDGFWANGMGAEAAVRAGTGTVVVDDRHRDHHRAPT